MQNRDKLIELVEQAASAVTMLSPADYSEVDQLQAIFTQISEHIAVENDGPLELLRQTQDTVFGLSELVEKMLLVQADDSGQCIDALSKSVMELQEQIKQVTDPHPEIDGVSDEAVPETNESASDELRIPQDDVPLVLDFIAESCEHIESAEAGLLELETKPGDKEVLNLIFRAFHTIKGMAGFLNLVEIGSLAHLTENLLDMARKGELLLVGARSDILFESIDLMKKMIDTLKVAIETQSGVPIQENLPILLKKLEAAASGNAAESPQPNNSQSDLHETAEPKSSPVPAEPKTDGVSQEDGPRNDVESPKGTDHKISAADEKIKVSTTRLDDLVNMAGELVIAQLMVAEEAASGTISQYELNRKVSHQGKIIREIQELSMSMRMVQISGVFQKMTRLVRDVSRKAEKQIDFVTEGEETELDRSIVDKIADPLIHMLRNSVDHGVESPEKRRQAGKDPVGKIELRAFHQAGNIVIEIEDDGKGLDKERILKKAIDNGIVDAEQQLTDDQIYKLIFHAGLSTAEKITSVSGRGVGMDVVKKNIESLRGRVDITSTPGKGTIFTIRLPLTLAMIDGQVVTVGENRYIVPINAIIGTLRPQADQISTVQGRFEMVLVRGELMPLIRLYRLFSVTPKTEDPTEALLVIVEDDERKCCLLVDDLLAQQRVVIKNLGDGLGKVDCASGGAIMGDGKVSLILDIPSVIKRSQD
jgi:two-component system chemotaxis sensor kinase CheA